MQALMPQQRRPPLKADNTVHTLQALPYGDAGVKATLREMRDIVRTWRKHPRIRNRAIELTSGCPSKAWACEVHRLHEFVRDRVRYVQDVRGVETLQTPEHTLRLRAGDCDDQCILLASLLEAVGHPARFVAVAFRPGGQFSHVFTETQVGGYWVACETTEPWPLGRRPPGIRRHLIQRV